VKDLLPDFQHSFAQHFEADSDDDKEVQRAVPKPSSSNDPPPLDSSVPKPSSSNDPPPLDSAYGDQSKMLFTPQRHGTSQSGGSPTGHPPSSFSVSMSGSSRMAMLTASSRVVILASTFQCVFGC
jgi:hypothetical protein